MPLLIRCEYVKKGGNMKLVLVVCAMCLMFMFMAGYGVAEVEADKSILQTKIIKSEETKRAAIKRNRLTITIVPTEDQANADAYKLLRTAQAVALEQHKKTEMPVITVWLLAQKSKNSYGELPLAHVCYIPDGLGFDGETKTEIWETKQSAERGFSPQELTYLSLWAELRETFLDKDEMLNEEGLTAAIAQKMGLKEDLSPHLNFIQKR